MLGVANWDGNGVLGWEGSVGSGKLRWQWSVRMEGSVEMEVECSVGGVGLDVESWDVFSHHT